MKSKKATQEATAVAPHQGMDAASIEAGVRTHLQFTLAELPEHVDSEWEPYVSLALAVRDRLIERWIQTQDTYYEHDAKRVYYLSLEFLMGRTLGNSLVNLGLVEPCHAGARTSSATTSTTLREAEWDAGLGNGGLGRLAACFLDSLATLAAARVRLRHPLRVRHLPPAHRRRRTGRDARTTGCASATRGRSRGPSDLFRSSSTAACTST